MRVRRERVAQEDHELDEAAGDHRADLQIAAEGAREDAAHVQLELAAQDAAGGRGRHDGLFVELVAELLGEREHLVLVPSCAISVIMPFMAPASENAAGAGARR